MLTLQRLIADLAGFLGRGGLPDRAALRHAHGRRHDASGDVPEGPGARSVALRLRSALPPPRRRPLRREPVPPGQAPAAPGRPEAFTRGRAGDLPARASRALGIALAEHDIRFEEDNWESPTLGAWGVGWQVVMDGMEITQFTYFQQAGGIDLSPITAEITYGLERIAMFLSKVELDLRRDVERDPPLRRSAPCRGGRAVAVLPSKLPTWSSRRSLFDRHERRGETRARSGLRARRPTRRALSCSHAFNLLDARGAVSATDRVGFIRRVRDLACSCARAYLAAREGPARAVSQPEPAAV